MSARVVVSRALPGGSAGPLDEVGPVWVSPHDRALTAPELRAAVPGAEALLVTLNDRVDAALLAAAGPQLRIVANTAVGYDNVDVEAVRAHGAVLTNTPGVLTAATADLTLGLLLNLTRRIGEGERWIRSGRPWTWDLTFLLGTGLQGKRLGVVGMGAIGRAVATRAAAFGMELVHHSRSGSADDSGSTRVELDELLATADVVSLHCPLTPATRHLIDATALVRMRSTAFLINTARGPVVDENALVDALRSGVIAGAALDVYEDEPVVHPGLLDLDNVVLAPHLGSATQETRTQMAQLAVANTVAVLRGHPPRTPVPVRSV